MFKCKINIMIYFQMFITFGFFLLNDKNIYYKKIRTYLLFIVCIVLKNNYYTNQV